MANCPMCGEPWNGFVCGECVWSEMGPSPRWFQRCNDRGHETSVSGGEDGSVEWFCHDCHGGAGRGEKRSRVKAGATEDQP